MSNTKIVVTLFTVILFVFFINCKNSSDRAMIKFDLPAGKTKKINIQKYDLLSLDLLPVPIQIFDSLNRKISVEVNKPFFGLVEVGDLSVPIYFAKGADLNVRFSEGLKGFSVTGRGAGVNKFLSELKNLEDDFFEKTPGVYALETESFEKKIGRLQHAITSVDIRKLSKDGIQIARAVTEVKTLNYHLNHVLVRYDLYDSTAMVPQELESSFEIFERNLILLKTNHIDFGAALHFYFDAVIYPKIWKALFNDGDGSKSKLYVMADEYLEGVEMSDELKSVFKAKNIINSFQRTGINENSKFIFEKFKKYFKGSKYFLSLNKIYNDLSKLKAKEKVPEIIVNTWEGNEMAVSKLEGEMVLVDIWATWCKPCIEEFPYVEKLQEKFKNEKMNFVYVSVDEDVEKWKKYLIENNQKNHAHFIEKEKGTLFNKFRIESIPRYVLIDEHGYFIDADAPKPSSGELEKMIIEFLSF